MENLLVENVWNDYLDFICKQNVGLVQKKVKKFCKKGRFADLSIMLGVLVTFITFLIKSAEYLRIFLVFNMYKIDVSYVEVDDKVLFKAIWVVEAVIFFFLINFVICWVKLNNNRLKRTLLMLLIYSVELLSIYMFTLAMIRIPLVVFKGMTIKDALIFLILALLILLLCIPLNMFGGEASKYVLAKQSGGLTDKIETGIGIKIVLLVLLAVLCVAPFALVIHEANRTNFKIISESSELTEKDYLFEDCESGEKRLIYVVVYENEDYYFTCLLKHDFNSKSVYIDTSIAKTYSKMDNDILTQYFSDIKYFSKSNIRLVK